MKKMMTTVMVAMIAIATMAVPARPVKKTLTTADGSTVEATLRGDEYGHFWLGDDGQRYRAEEDGTYSLIEEAAAEQTIRRAAARKAAINKSRTLNIAPKGLLILVNFSDLSFKSSNSHAEMDSMLNGYNYRYNSSIGSARQYFYEQSNGTYNPHFDVVGPVTLPKTMSYYGSNGSDGDGGDQKLGDMVLHACSIASGLEGVDLADYDNDNDGQVDFVYIIYAGYGEADGGAANTIWPASWDMASAVSGGYTSLSTRATASSYTFDGKVIGNFAYSAELDHYYSIDYPLSGYSSSNPKRAGIGTFCHEFSHVIGLPDYYDTQYGSNYDNNLTPGCWSLMDGGSYNSYGEIPPSYSIYDKYYVGWATPTVLNEPANITLPADGQTGYYITSGGVTATPETTSTVYYLENRQLTSWDAGLPGHGLLVWAITYNSQKWDNNTPNNTSGNCCVKYVPADGAYSDTQGDDGDTYPGTSNKTNFTYYSCPITEIAEQSGVISFKVMGGITCDGYSVHFTGTKATLSSSSSDCLENGESYQATIAAMTGYELSSVTVTMGGTTVSGAVTMAADNLTANINIQNVNGAIVITAVATKQQGAIVACDDYSWTASDAVDAGEVELGDYTWTVSSGSSYTGYDTQNGRGAQFGSKNSSAGTVSLLTEATADCQIETIVINAAKSSRGNGTMGVYIGGTQLGSTISLSGNATNYTFQNSNSLQGNLEIRYSASSMAVYLKSINITMAEEEPVTPPSAVDEVSQQTTHKYIQNGRMYIEVNGVIYDLMGRKL